MKGIWIPIYNQQIRLISGDLEECLDYLRDVYHTDQNTIPFQSGTRAACYNVNDDIWVYINMDDIDIPMLSHELSHATFDLMEYVGLELSDQEAFCYLQEYIFEEVLKFMPFKITKIDENV